MLLKNNIIHCQLKGYTITPSSIEPVALGLEKPQSLCNVRERVLYRFFFINHAYF